MDYGYKITTHGRAVLAACLDLGRPLKLTRAAVGSGLADKDEDLAKVHALVRYAAEASIADRRHEEDRLFLTVRYSNLDHPDVETFTLSEFMVWAEDPETGRETDFLYATLGDFRQAVPGYSEHFPASVWSYPLVLVVSGELQVLITASPGLATTIDLQEAIDRLKLEIMQNELTLPLSTASGEALLTNGGAPLLAVYHPNQLSAALDAMADLEGRMEAGDAASRAYADSAGRRAIANANAYTAGELLDLTGKISAAKQEAITAAGTYAEEQVAAAKTELTGKINTAKSQAVSAAATDATKKDKVVEKRLIYRIANDFNKHNCAGNAHPGTLAVSGLGPPITQLPVPEDVADILDDYIDILNIDGE